MNTQACKSSDRLSAVFCRIRETLTESEREAFNKVLDEDTECTISAFYEPGGYFPPATVAYLEDAVKRMVRLINESQAKDRALATRIDAISCALEMALK